MVRVIPPSAVLHEAAVIVALEISESGHGAHDCTLIASGYSTLMPHDGTSSRNLYRLLSGRVFGIVTEMMPEVVADTVPIVVLVANEPNSLDKITLMSLAAEKPVPETVKGTDWALVRQSSLSVIVPKSMVALSILPVAHSIDLSNNTHAESVNSNAPSFPIKKPTLLDGDGVLSNNGSFSSNTYNGCLVPPLFTVVVASGVPPLGTLP